jgi:hypothetical protein
MKITHSRTDLIIHIYTVPLSFIVQKEQAEREQDWEREQQEKREALEAAQRELDEVLNNKSAEILFHNKLSNRTIDTLPLQAAVG